MPENYFWIPVYLIPIKSYWPHSAHFCPRRSFLAVVEPPQKSLRGKTWPNTWLPKSSAGGQELWWKGQGNWVGAELQKPAKLPKTQTVTDELTNGPTKIGGSGVACTQLKIRRSVGNVALVFHHFYNFFHVCLLWKILWKVLEFRQKLAFLSTVSANLNNIQ